MASHGLSQPSPPWTAPQVRSPASYIATARRPPPAARRPPYSARRTTHDPRPTIHDPRPTTRPGSTGTVPGTIGTGGASGCAVNTILSTGSVTAESFPPYYSSSMCGSGLTCCVAGEFADPANNDDCRVCPAGKKEHTPSIIPRRITFVTIKYPRPYVHPRQVPTIGDRSRPGARVFEVPQRKVRQRRGVAELHQVRRRLI